MSGTAPQAQETDLYKIVQSIRELFQGRSHAVGTVTLTANAASTTVSAKNCGVSSRITLMPETANAAAALATTYVPTATIKPGSFVITHANNAQVDKTFGYCIQG